MDFGQTYSLIHTASVVSTRPDLSAALYPYLTSSVKTTRPPAIDPPAAAICTALMGLLVFLARLCLALVRKGRREFCRRCHLIHCRHVHGVRPRRALMLDRMHSTPILEHMLPQDASIKRKPYKSDPVWVVTLQTSVRVVGTFRACGNKRRALLPEYF